MTLNQAIALAGSREALARMLGVATISTYHWKKKIPNGRLWQLQALKPEWFQSKDQKKTCADSSP